MNSYITLPNGKKKVDYSKLGSEGYTIDYPETTYDDPSSRRVKVIAIGAGVSTIMSSYYIQKMLENVELVAYEKNKDIGGTWLENRYPGVACDVPAHAYAMTFAPNPDWSRLLATGDEVWKYLNRVCDVFELRKYMRFNSKVLGLYWQEETGKWLVKVRQQKEDGSEVEFEDTCDLVLYNKGLLNTRKWPDMRNLNKFKGRVIHTAEWPEDYQKAQWENTQVAVIGSGASSIQVVPSLQPFVKGLDVFARNGVWFIQLAEQFAQNHQYSEEEREKFRKDPEKLVAHAKELDAYTNRLLPALFAGSPVANFMREHFKERMSKHIKDERLLKGFLPNYGIGCRRVTPGDPYMAAIQEPNVNVHFTGVEEATEDGVIGTDGIERKVDTIICASGFDTSYRPPFPIVGRNGVDLREKWAEDANGYLGVAVPDIPNFIIALGPAWPVINGSVVASFQATSLYGIEVIKKMQRDWIKSWAPKQEVTDQFNQHVQEWVKHTVWRDSCNSWYRNNETGRVNSVWPGSALHFRAAMASPRWEDMHIQYQEANMFANFGLGYVREDRDPEKFDVTPYMKVESIDPKWWAAVSSDANGEAKKPNGAIV